MLPDPSKPKPVDSSQQLKPSITPKKPFNLDSKEALSFLDPLEKNISESVPSHTPAPPSDSKGNYQALQFLDISEDQSRATASYSQTKRLERQKSVGGIIDHYKLERVFKENSWSITYIASLENSQETFFLRLLRASVLQIPGAVEEIENALNLMQSWKREDFLIFSPLIRSKEGIYFLAHFQDLFLLKDHPEKKLNAQQSLKIISKLIEGLIFLREKTVLHRQLNLSTILIDKQNRVIFDELELSCVLERRVQENNIHRNPDFLELNNDYHSLEFINGQWVDPRSDICSLGLILFELLAGEYPFKALSPEQQKLRQMTNTLGDLKKLNPLSPEEIQKLVLKCCAGEPVNRYQSLEELREGIEKIRKGWASPTGKTGATRRNPTTQTQQQHPVSGSVKKSPPRNAIFWIAVVVPLLILLVFVMNSQKSIREDSDQLWVVDHSGRCAGIIQSIEEKKSSIRVVLNDFENIQRILNISNEVLQEQKIRLTEGNSLVCEGRVFVEENGTLSLNVAEHTLAHPHQNHYYQQVTKETTEENPEKTTEKQLWEEISSPNWENPLRIEGPILRLIYEENQCFIQLGEGDDGVKFFVPLKILQKLNFSPRLGQILGVEFYQNIFPLKVQNEKHLTRLESWIPGK